MNMDEMDKEVRKRLHDEHERAGTYIESLHRYITSLEKNLAYHRKTVAELRDELERYKHAVKEGT
jgi:predicted RNase H-like nuclease (RuvC/YqgF family)